MAEEHVRINQLKQKHSLFEVESNQTASDLNQDEKTSIEISTNNFPTAAKGLCEAKISFLRSFGFILHVMDCRMRAEDRSHLCPDPNLCKPLVDRLIGHINCRKMETESKMTISKLLRHFYFCKNNSCQICSPVKHK